MKYLITSILFVIILSATVSAQWIHLGTNTSAANDVAAHGGVLLYTDSQGTYVSNDAGANWEKVGGKGKSIVWVGDGFFVGQGRGEDFKTDPAGHNFVRRGYCSYGVNRFFFDSTNGTMYAATQRAETILMSPDTGGVEGKNTWVPAEAGSQDMTNIHARGNRIMGFYNGIGGLSPASMVYSVDGRATWKYRSWPFEYFGKKYGYTTGAFIAQNGDMYATSNTGPVGFSHTTLWRSRNDGVTWDSLMGGAPPPLLVSNMIYTEGNRILFSAGLEIWFSSNDGASWAKMQEGISDSGSGSISKISLDEGNVYVLVDGKGIYRRPMADFGFTGMLTVKKQEAHASPIRLVERTNGTMSVALSINKQARVKLEVFDILGRKTATIYEGYQSDGEHMYYLSLQNIVGFGIIRADIDGKLYSLLLSGN